MAPTNQNKTKHYDADVLIISWLMGFELNGTYTSKPRII